jgi:hypothetical protein
MFGTGPDGKPLSKEEYKTRLSRIVSNPFLLVIAQSDSLKLDLTTEQKTALRALSDEIAPKIDQLADEMADLLTSAGSNPDPAVMGARMQGKTNDARKLAEKSVADLQKALTPVQWAKLPESIKTPPQNRGFGGPGGDVGGGRGAFGGGNGGGGRPPQ